MLLSPKRVWQFLDHARSAACGAIRAALATRLGAGSGSPFVATGRVMGTYYVITLGRTPRRADPDQLRSAAEERLARVEALMSAYRTDSDVCRFNAAGAGEWVTAARETVQCLEVSRQVGAASGGLFDITAGPLVRLWGFGPGEATAGIPDDQRVAEARGRMGSDRLEVRADPPALRKLRDGIELDLASVAKGFAVDLAAERLDALGARDYCVEVGGEIRTRGRNARGQSWRIAIERPADEQSGIQRIVPLSGSAIATSGDYRIYRDHEGRRYPHVIDPRTGRPVGHELASVSVVGASCAAADAWATALTVAGPQAGYELAVGHGLAALFITRTPLGLSEKCTPSFPAPV